MSSSSVEPAAPPRLGAYIAFVEAWVPNFFSEVPKRVRCGILRELRDHVASCREMYGDDGFGAKPEGVDVHEYWLQQQPETSPLLQKVKALGQPAPKRAAKRKSTEIAADTAPAE